MTIHQTVYVYLCLLVAPLIRHGRTSTVTSEIFTLNITLCQSGSAGNFPAPSYPVALNLKSSEVCRRRADRTLLGT